MKKISERSKKTLMRSGKRLGAVRLEASKKIVIFCDVLTGMAVITTFIGWLAGYEPSGLDGIVTAVIALSGAAHSFYFWKAKAENLKKFGMLDKMENIDAG